jgi:pimeloyl-ACP methyl ester carboxylesterase
MVTAPSSLSGCRFVVERSARWLAGLALLLGVGHARAEDIESRPINPAELCGMYWTIDADWLPYCRTQRLGELRQTIRRAVVVVHGKNRNAKSYFDAVTRLAREEGHADDTLVIGMQFLTRADAATHRLPANMLYWDTDGWKHGHKALNGSRLSSFEVLDRLLRRLIDQNPNLEQIIIAGHSAGAQFVQKHALGRKLDTSDWKGQLRYVVTNPGTYMYLTRERPEETKACKADYNDYRFGVERNPLEYFVGTSPDSLWKNLAEFPVTILLGDEDTEQEDGDNSCPALAQGKNRFERGKHFYRLTSKELPAHVPGADVSRFQLRTVRYVGHDFQRMWDSRCGRDMLFGKGQCPTMPSALPHPPRAAFPIQRPQGARSR